jgi:hypothetical protein
MQYRLATLLAVAALGCGGGSRVHAVGETATVAAEGSAGGEVATASELELRADATAPAELRERMEHPLERPSLARIERPPVSSWVFAAHPSAMTDEESRPALEEETGEPHAAMSTVTSDPVGRELITTMAEADTKGARLRYVP